MIETPNGTKRITGFVILILSLVLPMLGLRLSDAAPVEMALFVDAASPIVGLVIALWGEYSAKAPLWFSKNS